MTKNQDLYYLNLPTLDKELQKDLFNICNSITISTDRTERINSYYNEKYNNIAAQEYGTEQVPPIPRNILENLQNLYNPHFAGGCYFVLGKAKNLSDNTALTPPHCDRSRQVAINYLLETGGTDVVTSLYDQHRDDLNLCKGENKDYSSLSLSSSYIIPEKKWHVFNAQQYHSVENLQGERLYLAIVLFLNPTYKEFLHQYNHLLEI